MGKDNILGVMAVNTMVNGKTANNMEKGYTLMRQMARHGRAFGLMDAEPNGLIDYFLSFLITKH